MFDSVLFYLGQGGLILLSIYFAYKVGRLKERIKNEKESKEALEIAKQVRENLHDPVVVDQLHAKYKR